ncbi:MAG TPA: hypothetical protein VJ820_19605 [Propionibacteriaceae bacterium]|nr:hypothetical protein [Propionibacteriaceae bacterium]
MTLNGVVSPKPSVEVVSISWLPSESDPGGRNGPERHCPERVLGEVWVRVLQLLDRGALRLERDTVERELKVLRRQ